MTTSPNSTGRTLFIAFLTAVVVPCGVLVFFGIRALRLEGNVARTEREERLRQVADILARQLDNETLRLKQDVQAGLWALGEPAFELESIESGIARLVRNDRRLRSGVVFDDRGNILGPKMDIPFRIDADGGGPRDGDDTITVRPGETVDMAEERHRRGLVQMQQLREALFEEKMGEQAGRVLPKLRTVEATAEDENIRALATYHKARIRLDLGSVSEVEQLCEVFIGRDLVGPLEGGIPLRGRFFLLWTRAWTELGSPGRALEILFWFWRELLDGRFDLDGGQFDDIEENLGTVARDLIESVGPEGPAWRERLAKFEDQGAACRKAAGERLLLADDILPRVAQLEVAGAQPRFLTAVLGDRLQIFLYLPPTAFEVGMPGDRRAGAGVLLDLPTFYRETLEPILQSLTSSEVTLSVVDHGGRHLGAKTSGAAALEMPLPEPFGSWRVVVTPGPGDPTSSRRRTRSLFNLALIATAVLAVFASGTFLLRTTRREAQLAALRSEFVSTVTHDLKTPLTSIRMFTETLRMGRLRDEEKVFQYYGLIGTEVERLERLIDDILEFARIEAGRKEYDFEPLDLHALVEGVLEAFRPSATAAGFTVEDDLADVPRILGDADALRRALWNLLSNGVKFSVDTKHIRVVLCREDGEIDLSVEDRGIGIPAREKEKIFEKFYRGEETQKRPLSGTGLGLALVRHVVRGHNGSVRIESEPGRGSTFHLRFPCEANTDG